MMSLIDSINSAYSYGYCNSTFYSTLFINNCEPIKFGMKPGVDKSYKEIYSLEDRKK